MSADDNTGASEQVRSMQRAEARGYLLSGGVQILLCALGTAYIISEVQGARVNLLLPWCVIATAYGLVAVIGLMIRARNSAPVSVPPPRLEFGRFAKLISLLSTIGASVIGVGSALLLVSFGSSRSAGFAVSATGVWAMLLSWGLLHWGFAQLYYQGYYAAPAATMRFPETPHPRLIEFAYFSFTMGTSFAASDVDVQTSRARLWVLWHSVVSFFFNGLIIVFALNTILNFGSS